VTLIPLLALILQAADPPIILGVLEDVPSHYVGESPSRAVRVVFQKQGREWHPFPSSCEDQPCLKVISSKFPPSIIWNIGFSGRTLGQVTATTPKDFEYDSSVGLQKITSKTPIPTIGNISVEFAGYLGSPVRRPLIANSRPYFKDPDAWKPSPPSPDHAAAVRLAFRKKFPKVSNCTAQDTSTATPWPYRDADLNINKSYSSNKGWSAMQIVLAPYRCDGPQDDPFIAQWFAASPSGELIFLGEGLTLVDAADYANEGKSELIFAIGRYNRGGYELFYNDFHAHGTFQFSYH
jgi:hypothetical protein